MGDFDEAAEWARGKKLKTGPRGGGRSLAKIVGHVVGSEGGYVRTIRGKAPEVDERQARAMANVVRGVALEALTRAVTEGLPDRGPVTARSGRRAISCDGQRGTCSTTRGRSRTAIRGRASSLPQLRRYRTADYLALAAH